MVTASPAPGAFLKTYSSAAIEFLLGTVPCSAYGILFRLIHDGSAVKRQRVIATEHADGEVIADLLLESKSGERMRLKVTRWVNLQSTRSVACNERREYDRDLDRVRLEREAGLDPSVDISFICRIAGRSEATIYRDVSKGLLARPLKLGRASRWPFSAVQAYMGGKAQ